jgi:hypothetical protein
MLLPSERVTVHSERIPNGWRYVVSIDGIPKTVLGYNAGRGVCQIPIHGKD